MAGDGLVGLVGVVLNDLLTSVKGNACLGLVGKAGPQDRNTQAAEGRMACCNLDQVQNCLAEDHSRDRIVAVDSSCRIVVAEGSLVEGMVADPRLGVVEQAFEVADQGLEVADHEVGVV